MAGMRSLLLIAAGAHRQRPNRVGFREEGARGTGSEKQTWFAPLRSTGTKAFPSTDPGTAHQNLARTATQATPRNPFHPISHLGSSHPSSSSLFVILLTLAPCSSTRPSTQAIRSLKNFNYFHQQSSQLLLPFCDDCDPKHLHFPRSHKADQETFGSCHFPKQMAGPSCTPPSSSHTTHHIQPQAPFPISTRLEYILLAAQSHQQPSQLLLPFCDACGLFLFIEVPQHQEAQDGQRSSVYTKVGQRLLQQQQQQQTYVICEGWKAGSSGTGQSRRSSCTPARYGVRAVWRHLAAEWLMLSPGLPCHLP